MKKTKKKTKAKRKVVKKIDQEKYSNPLKGKQKEMIVKCITKFWQEIRPKLVDISTNPFVEGIVGQNAINKYGYEGGLEETIRLFKKGSLKIIANNPEDFFVYMTKRMKGSHLNDFRLLYDTNPGRERVLMEFFNPKESEK